jgi:hypothetical protein
MTREGIIKHKEVFDAWMGGAEVEIRSKISSEFVLSGYPAFHFDREYRVKQCKFEKARKDGLLVQCNSKSNDKYEAGWVKLVEGYPIPYSMDLRIVREEFVKVDGSELKVGDVWRHEGGNPFKCLALFTYKGTLREVSENVCGEYVHSVAIVNDSIEIKRTTYEY